MNTIIALEIALYLELLNISNVTMKLQLKNKTFKNDEFLIYRVIILIGITIQLMYCDLK